MYSWQWRSYRGNMKYDWREKHLKPIPLYIGVDRLLKEPTQRRITHSAHSAAPARIATDPHTCKADREHAGSVCVGWERSSTKAVCPFLPSIDLFTLCLGCRASGVCVCVCVCVYGCVVPTVCTIHGVGVVRHNYRSPLHSA